MHHRWLVERLSLVGTESLLSVKKPMAGTECCAKPFMG